MDAFWKLLGYQTSDEIFYSKKIAELEEVLKEDQSQIASLKDQLKLLEEDKEEKLTNLASLNCKLEQDQLKIALLNSQLEFLEKDKEEELKDKDIVIEYLDTEIVDLKKENKYLADKLNDKNGEINALKTKLDEAKEV